MSLNLITDRTAADLAAAREIIAKVQRGETLTEAEQSQFDAGLRGCYNASDLNRVEAAVKSIAAALNAAGYAVEVGETKHRTLPEGYTILEYIESTGTQYIDTGFKPGNTTQLAMDFEPTTLPASHVMAAGARNNSNGYTEQFVIGWAGHKSPAVWRSDFGSSQVSFATSVEGAIRHHLDKDGAACTMDSTTVTNTSSTFTCAYTLYLFAGNQNDEAVSQISMKLYVCRIYDNGTLVRNYIPCRNPDGEVGLYDTITQSFYGNAGASAFVEPVTLPSGYTQLEYLQSTGTQYIDTGFKPNQDTRVVCKTVCEVSSTANWVFGARTSNASNQFTFLGASAGTYASGFATAAVNFPAPLNTTNPIVVDKNKTVTNINGGNAVTNTAATFTAPVNLALFAVNTNGTISYGKVKLYYVQVYDNGTLIRNMVPAQNSAGTLGMYDTVNSVFYANAGSGTFTAGAEISKFTAGAEISKSEARDWQTTDIIRLSQWRQYLANVQALRDAYYTLAETGQLPDAADRLDYIGANTIEKILADIDLLLDGMKSIYRRAGTFSAGGSYTRQIIRSV